MSISRKRLHTPGRRRTRGPHRVPTGPHHIHGHLRSQKDDRARPRRKRLIRPNRVPKLYRSPLHRLESHPARERRVLSLKQIARRIMSKRRAELRAKHVHGGKVLVGSKRHGGGGGWKGHHRHGKLSPKMRRYLLWKYHH